MGQQIKGAGDPAEAFATLRNKRLTEDGKACIAIAQKMYAIDSAEARQWCKLGLDCDNATTPKALKDLQDRLQKKAERAAKKAAMRGKPELKAVPGGQA